MRDRIRWYRKTGTVDKTPIIAMRERGGRTVAMPLENTGAATIEKVVHQHVEAGATLNTDEYIAYKRLGTDYKHKSVNHSQDEYSRNGVTTNGVESVFAVMRRGLHGVYHKASKKHMARYVNEFAWRLNDGRVQRHTLDRLNSFIGAVTGRQITYEELIADNGKDREARPL